MPRQRLHPRFPRRVPVHYWARGLEDKRYPGFTKDISGGGAFIATNRPFKEHSRIRVEFVEGPSMVLEGIVVRAKTYPREMQKIKTGGMGIRFLPTEELLAEIIPSAGRAAQPAATPPAVSPSTVDNKKLSDLHKTQPVHLPNAFAVPLEAAQAGSAAAPPSPAASSTIANTSGATVPGATIPGYLSRAYVTGSAPYRRPELPELGSEVPPELALQFETAADFLVAFERELRFRLLFVPTDLDLPVNSAVELLIDVVDVARRLRIPARVVHVPAISLGEGDGEPGLGVQISPAAAVERITALARELGAPANL